MKINIKKNWPLLLAGFLAIVIGIIVCWRGASLLSDAMASDAFAQLYKTGMFDPKAYASLQAFRDETNAKAIMLLGIAISVVGVMVFAIFFTCKWIRSLIPSKQETK